MSIISLISEEKGGAYETSINYAAFSENAGRNYALIIYYTHRMLHLKICEYIRLNNLSSDELIVT